MNILLIEDEIKAAAELKRLIKELNPQTHIIDVLQSVEESIEWFNSNSVPDLIFSDIQLADGLSFDIFQSIPVHAPIIFCTAFDEYSIRAFETNSIDYLLKPIDKDKLKLSLEKYDKMKKIFSPENEYSDKLKDVFDKLKHPPKSTLLVHYQDKIVPIKISDIDFIYYMQGIVRSYIQQQTYQLNETMDELEKILDEENFFRANRQFIVNRKSILNIEHYFARKLFVKLRVKTPENIIVSKAKASKFLSWLAK